MFTNILRTLRTAVIIIVCLLFFQIVIDIIQAHQVLQNVHPILCALFALTLAAACVTSITWYIISLKRHPLTLRPPPRRELDKAEAKELRAYGRYLCRVMQRLARNQLLPDINRADLESEYGKMRKALTDKSDLTLLIDGIRDAEKLRIQPAIKVLDKSAEREGAPLRAGYHAGCYAQPLAVHRPACRPVPQRGNGRAHHRHLQQQTEAA